ncbi:type I restriction-modification system subunit M N-terminal domain-containing protein [Ectopseudomonas oleovorans]|uniref:type I restriction-modification system subunit M N-terminal domain-containing protein n=1 Tax=Ectopseudomonas oleovorans TaxID=301 RepID=UPI003C766BFC
MNTNTLVHKIWNFCNTLRDDGVGYGDYLEQLTYLLFLKLAHEYGMRLGIPSCATKPVATYAAAAPQSHLPAASAGA